MGSQVHPTAIVGPGVELGPDVVVGPYAVLTGPCRIGDGSWIGAHAVIGAAPEIRGHEPGLPWAEAPEDLGVDVAPRLRYTSFEEPPVRQAGARVGSIQDLLQKLKQEAGVL